MNSMTFMRIYVDMSTGQVKIEPYTIEPSLVVDTEDVSSQFGETYKQLKHISESQSFTKLKLKIAPYEVSVIGESTMIERQLEQGRRKVPHNGRHQHRKLLHD